MTKRRSRTRRSKRLRSNPRRYFTHRVKGGGVVCKDRRTGRRVTRVAKSKRGKRGVRSFCKNLLPYYLHGGSRANPSRRKSRRGKSRRASRKGSRRSRR